MLFRPSEQPRGVLAQHVHRRHLTVVGRYVEGLEQRMQAMTGLFKRVCLPTRCTALR